MTYYWKVETQDGTELSESAILATGLDERFEDRASAEAWLGEYYLLLPDHGVTAVSLYEDEDCVFGPMSLDDASAHC